MVSKKSVSFLGLVLFAFGTVLLRVKVLRDSLFLQPYRLSYSESAPKEALQRHLRDDSVLSHDEWRPNRSGPPLNGTNVFELGKKQTSRYIDNSANGRGSRSPISTHQCIGPREIPHLQKKIPHEIYRSCHFTDVCFAPPGHALYERSNYTYKHGLALIYFGNENEDDGEMMKTMTMAMSLVKGPNSHNQHPQQYVQPLIVDAKESVLYDKVWSPIEVAIPFRAHHCTNFGHNMGDNVFPMYRLLRNFGLYRPDVSFLPMRVECGQKECGSRCAMMSKIMEPFVQNVVERPFHDTSAFYRYYNDILKSLMTERDYQTTQHNVSTRPLLCFQNVLSGHFHYTEHGEDPDLHGTKKVKSHGMNLVLVGTGDRIFDFRNDFMQRLGLNPNLHLQRDCNDTTTESMVVAANNNDASTAGVGSVVILPRPLATSRRFGWLEEELMSEIAKIWPNEEPFTVMNYTKHTITDQVRIVANAKVMVSMAGGAAYLGWFLPPGSSLILLKRKDTVNDDHVWDNLAYIKKTYFQSNDITAKPEVYDYVQMARAVRKGIEHYNRRQSQVRKDVACHQS